MQSLQATPKTGSILYFYSLVLIFVFDILHTSSHVVWRAKAPRPRLGGFTSTVVKWFRKAKQIEPFYNKLNVTDIFWVSCHSWSRMSSHPGEVQFPLSAVSAGSSWWVGRLTNGIWIFAMRYRILQTPDQDVQFMWLDATWEDWSSWWIEIGENLW